MYAKTAEVLPFRLFQDHGLLGSDIHVTAPLRRHQDAGSRLGAAAGCRAGLSAESGRISP